MMALRISYNSCSYVHYKRFVYVVRGIASALHIPGHLSNTAVSILTPDLSHIDHMIKNDLAALQKNLDARNSSFHLKSFTEEWINMLKLRSTREELEEKRIAVSQVMKQVVSNPLHDNQIHIKNIKKEGIQLRTQMKELTKVWWEVEEIAITRALKLPNSLHPFTPIKENQQISSFLPSAHDLPFVDGSDNLDIKFVDHSPSAFYLKNKAARLELNWMRTFSQAWITNGFNLISAPDFARSLVVDGCGLPFNNHDKILSLAAVQDHGSVEVGNGLHLVGGSSLPAIVALLVKTVIHEPFPLRLITVGRSYRPPINSPPVALVNAMQSSSINLLTALENCPNAMFNELFSIQERISRQLKELNIHFRISVLAARHLEPWEQYRSSIELYLPSSKSYVEVASVSIIGDFISRRLSIYGPDKDAPGFVSAVALCIPKLLACYLENEEGKRQRKIFS